MTVEPGPSAEAVRRVRTAAAAWRRSLLNVSGTNRLLHLHDRSATMLDLDAAHAPAVAALRAGSTVRVPQLFPAAGARAVAARTLRGVAAGGRTAAEELGIHVTYLVVGLATWDADATGALDPDDVAATDAGPGTDDAVTAGLPDDPAADLDPAHPDGAGTADAATEEADEGRTGHGTRREPRAPVLMRRVDVVPRAGTADGFELTVTGEPEVNAVLLHLLRHRFGVDLDETALLEHATDDDAVLDAVERACARVVPGFRVERRLVLGNVTYAERPLVEDLADDAADFLAASDLVAALAGDPQALSAVRTAGAPVSDAAPDTTPPGDEHLVLDADGSQSYVVNAIAAGQNLVVQGPPGTGKSQTIANAIAELVARGRTVLFVAQKRAAIEAVLDRLDRTDLGHLVLDLFTTGSSRAAVAQEVHEAMQRRTQVGRPRVEALHDELVEHRAVLVDAHDATHEVREPWGLALAGGPDGTWGLLDWAVATQAHAGRPTRLDADALARWDATTHERLRSAARALVDLGGVGPGLQGPGWSLPHLRTAQAVTAAHGAATTVASRLPPLARQVEALAAQVGAPTPATWAAADALVTDAGAADALARRGFGAALDPARDVAELVRTAAALGGRPARRAAGVGAWEARALVRRARAEHPGHDDATLAAALLEAVALRERRPAAAPPPYVALADLAGPWAQVRVAVDRLRAAVRDVPVDDAAPAELAATARRLAADPVHRRFPRLHALRDELVALGCAALVQDLHDDPPADGDEAADRLSHAFATTVLEQVEGQDPRLLGVDATVRDRAAERYAACDARARELNARRIARAAAERLADALDAHPRQAELLAAQLRRRRGLLPLRGLLAQAPDVLLAAKPVWAASPQTVSELLPQEQVFDVVIFDEASQIQPAAALPSIARARQVVVAGDSLQLPPTTVFTTTLDGDDEPDEDGPALAVQDAESILDAVEVRLGPQRSRHLSWHYRSRDERLIATSNRWVYEPVGRQMTTFPAADGPTSLQHLVVPRSRGVGRHNLSPRAEVLTVVDLVLEHARTRPEESLGVIAFGQRHAQRLTDELERQLPDAPDAVRAWFAPDRDEAFFLKNIERVQGDERSRIILTVGYGHGDDGRLRHAWGPVLQAGGHRRVNVAITRARRDLLLVTSFRADEVDERASDAEGFALMRRFITFAATAGASFGDEGPTGTPLNPFEHDVLRRLQDAGLDVTPQYGVGGYRLDFAVRHPHRPGRFLLAVEADGASYHSGTTARERDRLRQEALEARGWRFVRVWSTDWFRDPDAQVDRVLRAYRAALDEENAATRAADGTRGSDAWDQAEEPSGTVDLPSPAPTGRRGPRPLVPPGHDLAAYTDVELDAMVRWVTSDDVVRTNAEVYEAVKRELGFQRNGSAIVARIGAAVARRLADADARR